LRDRLIRKKKGRKSKYKEGMMRGEIRGIFSIKMKMETNIRTLALMKKGKEAGKSQGYLMMDKESSQRHC